MSFDRDILEARLALNRIPSAEMPRVAWDAMEAGFDGPAIRRLAALEAPTFFQLHEVLPAALDELHLRKLDKAEAALRLGRLRAKDICGSNSDPFRHLRDFEHLWWMPITAGNWPMLAILMTKPTLPGTADNRKRKFASGSSGN